MHAILPPLPHAEASPSQASHPHLTTHPTAPFALEHPWPEKSIPGPSGCPMTATASPTPPTSFPVGPKAPRLHDLTPASLTLLFQRGHNGPLLPPEHLALPLASGPLHLLLLLPTELFPFVHGDLLTTPGPCPGQQQVSRRKRTAKPRVPGQTGRKHLLGCPTALGH